ncbi:hypothetical protein [Kitasatospora acidiphila]|uniref:hypothetical protein n=1 Tax=Kitasatospora acidiphila TaxID=2567942 RepID=UPI003C78FA77
MDHRNTATALAGLALSAAVTVTGCAVERPGPLVNMGSSSPSPSPGSSVPSPGAQLEHSAIALPPSPAPGGSGPGGSVPPGADPAGPQVPAPAGPSASALTAPHPHARSPQSSDASRPEPSPGPHPPGQPESHPIPTAGGTGMCALGEQYGQLTPNSDQAQLCRGIYGG